MADVRPVSWTGPVCHGRLAPQARAALLVNTVSFGLLEASGKRGSILTPSGALNSWILGVILWGTLGAWGWGTCVLYLFAGSAVTKIRKKKKEVRAVSRGKGGGRRSLRRDESCSAAPPGVQSASEGFARDRGHCERGGVGDTVHQA